MDEHFKSADAGSNLPLLMGLIGIWHRNICKYPARAIIPYDQRLSPFSRLSPRLDVESNGKRVTKASVASPAMPRGRWCGASTAPMASTPFSNCCIRAPT